MTLEELENEVVGIKDRLAIRELMSRYSRGVDRLDKELLLSVYHPDAVDDHGCYIGDRDVFAECALSMEAHANKVTHHIVTNHVCDLDGNVAHCETYWLYVAMHREGDGHTMAGGRYIDRLEKREGKWGIVVRKCLVDWGIAGKEGLQTAAEVAATMKMDRPARDRTDPSYERPLEVTKGRLALGDEILAQRRARRRTSPEVSELLGYD